MVVSQEEELTAARGLLVLAQVSNLRVLSCVNMLLAMVSVTFMGVNIVCIICNCYDNEDPETAVVSLETFHRLEFWGTFIFNMVDVFALIYSTKKLNRIYWSPLCLKLIICLNVGGSLITALLVEVNLEKFEVPAHELEYSNEITMCFVDIVLFASLVRGLGREKAAAQKASLVGSLGIVLLATFTALIQLVVYNCMGWEDGEPEGEQAAHFLEFGFELLSAGITFWFTVDNKLHADMMLEELMQGAGNLCGHSCSEDSEEDFVGLT
mmetsp:Transcript_130148/g.278115  ORF Transcript_130148/g.278115 Transcript_130148/m.278115 type:complete len:267 (-) Transcript_130148:277-1077(-)